MIEENIYKYELILILAQVVFLCNSKTELDYSFSIWMKPGLYKLFSALYLASCRTLN